MTLLDELKAGFFYSNGAYGRTWGVRQLAEIATDAETGESGVSLQGNRRHLPPQERPLQPGGIRPLGQVPGGAAGKRLEAGRRRRTAASRIAGSLIGGG